MDKYCIYNIDDVILCDIESLTLKPTYINIRVRAGAISRRIYRFIMVEKIVPGLEIIQT